MSVYSSNQVLTGKIYHFKQPFLLRAVKFQ